MKRIILDGVVGWDVLATDVRSELDAAKGEDIDLIINSPGGSVYEGLAIYNAIRDYRRDGGKVCARVVGVAASMATYIPMAADSVSVEDNAVWMIHNPWNIAIGDYNDMRKEAEILESMAALLAGAYVRKTGKKKAEIQEMMDGETFLFGQEILDSGFANEIEPAGDGAESKEEARIRAMASMENMKSKMRREPERQQLDQAAALIKDIKAAMPKENTAAKAEKEKRMDLQTLKNEHPEVFAEAAKIGAEEERARILALDEEAAVDPGNAKAAKIISEAKANGKTLADIQTRLIVAYREGGQDGENPPAVGTAEPQSTLSAEEAEVAKHFGLEASEMGGDKC